MCEHSLADEISWQSYKTLKKSQIECPKEILATGALAQMSQSLQPQVVQSQVCENNIVRQTSASICHDIHILKWNRNTHHK
jgi:hypothetical protein